MMVHQEKIAPPEPLPSTSERSDVLKLQRTIDSLEQENTWLKVQLVRVVRAIGKAASVAALIKINAAGGLKFIVVRAFAERHSRERRSASGSRIFSIPWQNKAFGYPFNLSKQMKIPATGTP